MKTSKSSSIENPVADSGYDSSENDGDRSKRGPDTGAPILFAKDTYIFHREFGKSSLARYEEIRPALEKVLVSEFSSSSGFFSRLPRPRRRPRPQLLMSIRRMVLGKTEADAKECVVVLCDESKCESVQQFLKKDALIKQLFEPNDLTTPVLEVVVKGIELKLKGLPSDLSIHCNATDLSATTFCGLSISFTDCDDAFQYGTFGGVVKAVRSDGEFVLLGMTAAHILPDFDPYPDLDDDLDMDTVHLTEECAHRRGSTRSSLAQSPSQDALEDIPSRDTGKLFELGKITADSGNDDSLEHPYLDWALFELKDVRPNHLPNSTIKKSFITASSVMSSDSDEIPVVLIGNSQNCRDGKISRVPSRIMLGVGTSFTDALLLTLDRGTVLNGESGAWVVSPTTLEVYGHVVAADVFGEAYVIPMQNTLIDMQRLLGSQSVDLPNDADLVSMQTRGAGLDAKKDSLVEILTTPQAVANEKPQQSTQQNIVNASLVRQKIEEASKGTEAVEGHLSSADTRSQAPGNWKTTLNNNHSSSTLVVDAAEVSAIHSSGSSMETPRKSNPRRPLKLRHLFWGSGLDRHGKYQYESAGESTKTETHPALGVSPEHSSSRRRTIPYFRRGNQPVYVFLDADDQITNAHQHRFADLKDILQRNVEKCQKLDDCLIDISYELRVCGTDESSASPAIVITCPAHKAKHLRTVIAQPHVRDQCRPGRNSLVNLYPELQIVIWAEPILRKSFGIQDSVDADVGVTPLPPQTLCGVQVIFGGLDCRKSTVACLVSVQNRRFALTTAHALRHSPKLSAPAEETNIGPRSDEEMYLQNIEEQYDFPDDETLGSTSEEALGQSEVQGLGIIADDHAIYQAPTDTKWTDSHPDLDWLLLELNDPAQWLPNIWLSPDLTPIPLSAVSAHAPSQNREVLILSPRGPAIHGTLRPIPSYIGGAWGSLTSEVWTVKIANVDVIRRGYSGSLVIDARDHKVYGQVVATSPLEDVHVIPLKDILHQIEEVFQEGNVSLEVTYAHSEDDPSSNVGAQPSLPKDTTTAISEEQ